MRDQTTGLPLHDENARKLRVLFLCNRNAARSQLAEAMLARKGRERFVAGSAGANPAMSVHPLAVSTLKHFGIDWSGRRPRGIDAAAREPWDIVITVCDQEREACPTFPSQPIFAHWSIPDPTEETDDDRRVRAFEETVHYVSRRIDLLLALPFERLERAAIETRLQLLGDLPSDQTNDLTRGAATSPSSDASTL